MQSTILNDQTTIAVLERLMFSEDKNAPLLPVDIAVLTYLILRRCGDHPIFDSFLTIAKRTCSDRQTVARSLERLERLKWVSVAGRGVGRTKAISVNVDTLPAAQPVREQLTPEAKQLAGRYMLALQKRGKQRFPKGWGQRQIPSAQRILTECGGDLGLARTMVGYALRDSRFSTRASQSLYALLAIWPKVSEAYAVYTKSLVTGANENAERTAAA